MQIVHLLGLEKIDSIQIVTVNPQYRSFRVVPEASLVESHVVLFLLNNVIDSEFKDSDDCKTKLAKMFDETRIPASSKQDNEMDRQVLKLFQDNLNFDDYKYNREDFKDNTAFLACTIFWESGSITVLSVDISLRMHLNGKHIKYKLNLIKAILPYLNDDIREDVERYVPMWSTPPRNPNE
jgi:hypothetical protein